MDNLKVLIVDDSSVMRKIVERSLRQAGLNLAQVVEAGNGMEALAVLQGGKVDLILCDINMPVMDGLEFVKQLSTMENGKGIPVVATSYRRCRPEPAATFANRLLRTKSKNTCWAY
jgi:two-component system, chemotaxis family, chemotaxis protein CheY